MTPPFQLFMRAILLQNNSLVLTEQQRCFPYTLSSMKYCLEIYTDYIDSELCTIQRVRDTSLHQLEVLFCWGLTPLRCIWFRLWKTCLSDVLLLASNLSYCIWKEFYSAVTSSGELNKLSKVSLT